MSTNFIFCLTAPPSVQGIIKKAELHKRNRKLQQEEEAAAVVAAAVVAGVVIGNAGQSQTIAGA